MGPRGAGLKAGQLAITGNINTGEPPASLGKDVWDQKEWNLNVMVDHRSCDLDICGEDQASWCPSWFLPSAVHEGGVKQVGGVVNSHLQRG